MMTCRSIKIWVSMCPKTPIDSRHAANHETGQNSANHASLHVCGLESREVHNHPLAVDHRVDSPRDWPKSPVKETNINCHANRHATIVFLTLRQTRDVALCKLTHARSLSENENSICALKPGEIGQQGGKVSLFSPF